MGINKKALLEIGRVSNLPTCVSNATVGFYLGGGKIFDEPLMWMMSILATVCFYEAGMVLNDLCDYKIDLIERPERPIPSGRISRSQALLGVLSLFSLGWIIVGIFFPSAVPVALLLNLLIVTYDLLHAKLRISPILRGLCRGSVYLLSACAAGWTLTSDSVVAFALALVVYIAAVSFIARDETTGRLSRLQKNASLVAVSVLLPVSGGFNFISAIALGIALMWLLPVVFAIFKNRIHPPKAVGQMLAAMSLFDGVILAGLTSMSGAMISWLCFVTTVLGHRKIRGT